MHSNLINAWRSYSLISFSENGTEEPTARDEQHTSVAEERLAWGYNTGLRGSRFVSNGSIWSIIWDPILPLPGLYSFTEHWEFAKIPYHRKIFLLPSLSLLRYPFYWTIREIQEKADRRFGTHFLCLSPSTILLPITVPWSQDLTSEQLWTRNASNETWCFKNTFSANGKKETETTHITVKQD